MSEAAVVLEEQRLASPQTVQAVQAFGRYLTGQLIVGASPVDWQSTEVWHPAAEAVEL